MLKKFCVFLSILALALPCSAVLAQADFNPHFIISDEEVQDCSWTRTDVQNFLTSRGSYLKNFETEDVSGTVKSAAEIIYDAATTYRINPKFLLVTLQKEQSLVTDDAPTQKQLDWATGYAVCDSCSMDDPSVAKHKGFGNQVDNAAGIIRWYYDNEDKSYVKKKGVSTYIDDTEVIPLSWATAFLYTYTPHLHGNKNFWRIWQTWFGQVYPNGSLLVSASSSEYYLIQDGFRRKFKNRTALITRSDPKMAILVPESELTNYQIGPDIAFPNYSLLKSPGNIYLLDYDTIRPFESEAIVYKMGYNPEEVIEVNESDLSGYTIGSAITASTTAPQGIIYQITDLGNTYYLLKDNVLTPILDSKVVDINFGHLKVEKHKRKELAQYTVADLPAQFKDGTLFKVDGSNVIYVIDKGKRRRIADDETFKALGYKRSNITTVQLVTAMNIPEGEPLFLNSSLLSSKSKFLGDNETPVNDLYGTKLPSYLVAEYPSGRILTGKNIDTVRPIASLTKIMTAYEALNQNFPADKITTYSKKKYDAENNSLNLVDGEKIKNSDLFNVMLVASINNTARMVAQSTGLSEDDFVAAVNRRLEEWGADDTTITDVTGLDSGNKSTARNLLKIFTKALGSDKIKNTLFQTSYTFREVLNKNKVATHSLKSTNQILSLTNRHYRILASKTGYTDEAGAVLMMLVESKKDKKQYVIITMGNDNYPKRFEEPHKIAEWAVAGKAELAAVK